MDKRWYEARMTGRFSNPALFERLRQSGVEGTLVEDNQIDVDDFDDGLEIVETNFIEPGKRIEARYMGGMIVCRTEEMRRYAELESKAEWRAKQWELRRERERERRETEEWWDGYDIPFEFDVAWKGRVDQLRRGSSMTGLDSRSVAHLFVLEEFEEGRLSRSEESYLCRAGGEWQFHPGDGSDIQTDTSIDTPAHKVECSKCLELMERWKV